MRHQVDILEENLDALAGLHDEPILVEEHLLRLGADAQHAHTRVRQVSGERYALDRPAA